MAFISNDETAELVEPCEGSLDDPSMLSQMLAAFDAASRDAWCDASGTQIVSAPAAVVALVGMQLVGPPSGAAASLAHRPDGVDDRVEGLDIVTIRAGQNDGERDASPVDQKVAFGAGLAPIRRVRADRIAPFLAGMEEESTDALDQSISPARLSLSSMWRWIRSHVPASCQARRRRQHVMPEQPATSKGRRSHGIAVYSTNRMPISASRGSTGGRPPFGRARSAGSNGAISAHKSSGSSFLAMRQARPNMVNKRFC